MHNILNRKGFIYIVLLLISAIFLGVFSTSTSPLFIGYGSDSSNYLMLGKMLLAGKTPYVDFFDHKGPMLIFIEAFGQSIIPDRPGLFILQIINLTFALIFLFETSNLFVNKTLSLVNVILCLLFFSLTMEGGNLSEEYSLPFLFLTLYLTCKLWLSDQKVNISFYSFIFGICGGILMWIRLNNLGITCACMLFIFILILKSKNWISLIKFVSFYIIGLLSISIPIFIYYYFKGALPEMFFASVLYNFQYVGMNENPTTLDSPVAIFFYILKAWSPFIILLIGTILYCRKEKEKRNETMIFSGLLLLFGYITTHTGSAFYHYMAINVPCLALGLAYIFYSLFRDVNKRIYTLSFAGLSLVLLISYGTYRYKATGGGTAGDSYYIRQAKDIVSNIPPEEHNSIYGYQTYSRFYSSAGVMPCYKYFIMQEWQGKFNQQLIIDINTEMRTNPPLWVVTQFRDMSTNDEFWKIIDEKYYLNSKNSLFELYRLK